MRISSFVSEQKPLKRRFLHSFERAHSILHFSSSHNPPFEWDAFGSAAPFHISPSIYARVLVGNDRKIFVLPA